MIEKKNPVKISLIDKDKYKLSIELGSWEVSKILSGSAIDGLLKEINNATGLTKICEVFNCNGDEAIRIRDFWSMKTSSYWCLKDCAFKWKECYSCAIMCQSPLERDLLLELRRSNLNPILQRRFKKDGSFYDFPLPIETDTILTIPDFYLEINDSKLCIYADGHTYHERSENQALRDRNIDRELQRAGYTVLRYTGMEIRKNCALVVENIQKESLRS